MDISSSLNVTEGLLDLKSSNHDSCGPYSSDEAEKTLSDCSCSTKCTSRGCKTFLILRDFLQPNTSTSLSNAVDRILKEFPVSEDYPVTGDDIFNLTCTWVDLAEQIQYYHSAHEKLARIACAIGNEEPKTSYAVKGFKDKLAMHLRDSFRTPHGADLSDEELAHCVNFHAFCAHLEAAEGTWSGFALWTMRDALEASHEKESYTVHEACIMTAAQWILWDGQGLFNASKSWNKDVTRKKWQAWKKEFIKAASSGQFGQECRVVAAKAAKRMDALDGETSASSIQIKA